MWSPSGPSPGYAFLAYHERNCLDRCPLEYRQLYSRWYVNVVFVLFKSFNHLKRFQSYLNFCHSNISITIETKQNNKISFLGPNVICEKCKFTRSVQQKLTFSGVYTHFDSFLPHTC